MAAKVVPYATSVTVFNRRFQKVEQDILALLGRTSFSGSSTFNDLFAFQEIQNILQGLIGDSFRYAPLVAESQYLIGKREAARAAVRLEINNYGVVENLSNNLISKIIDASAQAGRNLQALWDNAQMLRGKPLDQWSNKILEAVVSARAKGNEISPAEAYFRESLKNEGIVAFVDKSGRRWSLRAYGQMLTRTTARQATNLGTLEAIPGHDLYQISSHNTTCNICAPLEGRVYSLSGTNPNYPPLALAFGKINPNGPNTLDNSWLNIHPNCLHILLPYFEEGKTQQQLNKIRKFSNPETNPVSIDPRSAREIAVYRAQEAAQNKILNDYKQFERYKTIIGKQLPKTFETFQKHKAANSPTYLKWKESYRVRNRELKNIL